MLKVDIKKHDDRCVIQSVRQHRRRGWIELFETPLLRTRPDVGDGDVRILQYCEDTILEVGLLPDALDCVARVEISRSQYPQVCEPIDHRPECIAVELGRGGNEQ